MVSTTGVVTGIPTDVRIRAIKNVGTGQCIYPESDGDEAPIVLGPCQLDLTHLWNIISFGDNIYQLQSAYSQYCIWVHESVGDIAIQESCYPGNPRSNSEFRTSSSLPSVTNLRSHLHFTDQDKCLDGRGHPTYATLQTCNQNSVSQQWMIGLDI